ncbi:hypothetical protein HMN09_00920300 [Mycena chlorophos]|uniref:Uncharacterized protein n=1 Tax=Mycena chlorophos TaxID=658473 RepID=A0A8H6SM60_MYCCL|nr:hypothetical protein HMN09_00920300 [Mycena chlorophos]
MHMSMRAFLCRPKFFAESGLEGINSDPFAAVPYYVILAGQSAGAYTSCSELAETSACTASDIIEVVSWNEVLRVWASECAYKHHHDLDFVREPQHTMLVTLGKPLPPPLNWPSNQPLVAHFPYFWNLRGSAPEFDARA